MHERIGQALAWLVARVQNLCLASDSPNDREGVHDLQSSYETPIQPTQHRTTDMTTYTCFNSSAPIHRLPNELLVRIFSLTSPFGFDDYLKDLVRVALVSKHWNKIVFETPSLWTHISSKYSRHENRAAMIRSGRSPLRVDYSDGDGWDGAAFIFFAGLEAHRWQSVDLYVTDFNTLRILHKIVILSVPLLEELKVVCYGLAREMRVEESIDMFGGGADRLRRIELIGFPMSWSSQLLSRLETLKILGYLYVYPGPSASQITDMLHRCPKLRIFELEYPGTEEIRVTGDTLSEREAAFLPNLISFKLDINGTEAFRQIIPSVRAPSCTQYNLRCSGSKSNIFSVETDHFTAVLLSTVQSVPEISLMLTAVSLQLTGRDHQSNTFINIELSHDMFSPGRSMPWEDLVWLLEHCTESAPWPPIDTKIYCLDLFPFVESADILRRMSSIVKLTLISNSDMYITLLTHPILNNGTYEWVLPNLRELSLQDCRENSLKLLVELSGMRQGGVYRDQGEVVRLALPTKLEKFHVEMMSSIGTPGMGSFYTAIRELKGESWDGNMLD
ncbi:hypothetical protein FRB94_010819 [Tulasnella sp. JGI-2019a]|nr:hypothetical protein FRB94_010819 [Tulasnella sp. JGI-2019a]